MTNIAQLLTENMDIWTVADIEKKSGRGRASGNAGSVYGVKKLRELILELAVRGKLVPQDANDEPASELLKRIQAEKNKLIAAGRLKKEKLLAPIGEDEKPFELPRGWEWVRVSSISEIKGGKRLPEGKSFSPVATPYIYIQVTNMKNGTIIEENLKYIDAETKELIKNYTISSQDLYITIAGTIGDVGTVPTNFDGMILTENAAKIIFKELDKIWFKYCFKSRFLREQFQEKTIQLAQPKLALHRVASSVVALPPFSEQHRIVAKVDALLALCDKLEQQHSNAQEAHETLVSQLLATLTESQNAAEFNDNWQRVYANFDVLFTTEASIDDLKQTLLQLAVMGKLVPQDPSDKPAVELLKCIRAEKAKLISEGKLKKEKPLDAINEDEKPFALPKEWEWVRIGEICRPVSSGSTPSADAFRSDKGIPFLKVYNIRNQQIDFQYKPQFIEENLHKTKLKRSVIYPNDVVMNIVGPPLGKVAIIPDTFPEWNCNQAIVFFGLIKPMNEKYVLYFLKEASYLNRIVLIGTAGQDNISVTKSKNILLPIPPLNEQHRIVAKLDALMGVCDQLKIRIQQANQQQQAIADALVEQAVA